MPERLVLPAMAAPPPRPPFPFVATAAPVLVSVAIWAVTGSVYSLLFAALGPVVAVGSLLDSRRQRTRTAGRDADRTLAALTRAQQRVLELHERERARLERIAPAPRELLQPACVAARWGQPVPNLDSGDAAPLPVRLGRARRGPVVILDGGAGALEPDDDLPAAVRAALGEVTLASAALDDAPWLADAREGIGIVGPTSAAQALARSIALQLAATCSPLTTHIAATGHAAHDERWISALPHAVEVASADRDHNAFRLTGFGPELVVAWASGHSTLPPGLGVIVDLGSPAGEESRANHGLPPGVRLDLVGSAQAFDAANALTALAAERGMLAATDRIPEVVSLTEVLRLDSPRDPVTGPSLRAPVGRDASGVVELDLVRDGPHAVVAGTTGAGKSELLVSWVLAMAARHPPSAVTFLLIDFKGGAAFAPLAGLPHVIGTVSDLDSRRSTRAIESLRAELLRRERVLAERGVRSIDDLESSAGTEIDAGLARLVIVVDEFAAVVSGQPELHEFADLSGRGRSLGLHLILCTQRPSGVVRDAVLANVTLRISLRVTDRGDSLAMLGTDAATRLAPSARGRALVADGSGAIHELQLAIADQRDAEELRSVGPRPLETVWCDPLPELLPLDELLLDAATEHAAGVPFGRVDLPAEQRQPIAWHDPRVDGHLLVLGAARSGRTTALRTMAAAATRAGIGCVIVPDDAAEAWSLLVDLLERPERDAEVVLLDDLDLLVGGLDPDARHDLIELLTRFVRASRHRSLVVSAQRLSGGIQTLAGLFDARLLLRQPSRDEHVLSGGDGSAFDPRLPAGAGRWTGSRGAGAAIQVAMGAAPLPAAEFVELPVLRPATGRPMAVVCPRPAQLAREFTESGARVVVLGDGPAPDEPALKVWQGEAPVVLLGDSDAWQAEWGLLALARRELSVAVLGCNASELRAVTRTRDAAPPLGHRPGECWWVEAGVVRRALLEMRSAS